MQSHTQPRRALILGGGGQVGRAWLAGLLSSFMQEGVLLNTADLIVGTSAGSIVGAQLALGLLDVDNPPLPPAVYINPNAQTSDAFLQLYALMAQALESATPELARRRLGQLALEAQTMPEDQAIQRVSFLANQPWPSPFKATAVHVRTGQRIVWEKASGIALAHGVASSCALPGAFPPTSIGTERYMDGGVRSMLNADLAAGYDSVIVVSCFSLDYAPNQAQEILNRGLHAELDGLRQAGATVTVISPNETFFELTKQGTAMLNLALMPEAWQIGRAQALREKQTIDSLWYATSA